MTPWRQVPPEELRQLKDFLERRLPYSILVHGYVEMKLCHDLGFMTCQIYRATDPDLESVVAVVAASSTNLFQPISVYFDEGKVSDDKLASLLTCIPELDWDRAVVACGCFYIVEKLRSLITGGKLGRDLRLRIEGEGLLYTLKEDIPADTSLPDGMHLGRLNGYHADLVQGNWMHGRTETREAMKLMLDNLPSAAVFVTSSNMDDDSKENQPVSWIQSYPSGSMGNSFTLPEYRRKGLASAVTLALVRKIAASRRSTYLVVEHYNEVSKRMHEKMGFKVEATVSWDLYLPPGVTLEKL